MILNNVNIFVYGTLKKGEANHCYITNSNGKLDKLKNLFFVSSRNSFVGSGKTKEKFEFVECGYFPCAVLTAQSSNDSSQISGEVYSVSQETLQLLDKLESESSLFNRKIVFIEMKDGTTLEAYMYLLPEERLPMFGNPRKILSGFWSGKKENNKLYKLVQGKGE